MEIFSQGAFSWLRLFLSLVFRGRGTFQILEQLITTAMPFHVQSLESAISDAGKSIHPQHLVLVADSLSATGAFVSLNARGIARQREHASVSSPFMQACYSVSSLCVFLYFGIGMIFYISENYV